MRGVGAAGAAVFFNLYFFGRVNSVAGGDIVSGFALGAGQPDERAIAFFGSHTGGLYLPVRHLTTYRFQFLSLGWGSNPRSLPYHGSALPLSYLGLVLVLGPGFEPGQPERAMVLQTIAIDHSATLAYIKALPRWAVCCRQLSALVIHGGRLG